MYCAIANTYLPPLQGGAFLDVFPGLKPRAKSCSPFGTKTGAFCKIEHIGRDGVSGLGVPS